MEPDEKSPSQETDSEDAANPRGRVSAHFEVKGISTTLRERLNDAYLAHLESPFPVTPSPSWWSKATVKCCVDMLLSEGNMSSEDLKKIVLEYLAHVESLGRNTDLARQIRSQQAGGADVSRMPDPPLPDDCISAPFDLPRLGPRMPVEVRDGSVRLPDPFFREDDLS